MRIRPFPLGRASLSIIAAGLVVTMTACDPPAPPLASTAPNTEEGLYPSIDVGPPAQLLPGSTYTAEWQRVGDATTFGVQLCAVDGREIAIDSVLPSETVGTGFAVAGTRIVRFRRADGATLASAGSPSLRPGEQVVPLGTPGIEPCSESGEWATELQVVLIATGAEGGGWRGELVRYSGDSSGELQVDFGMLLCGTSTTRCAR